jgi:hypothetical protein
MFLAAVDNSIPKCTSRNVNRHPWIDKELLTLIKKKNTQRNKAFKTGSQNDLVICLKICVVILNACMIAQKKKNHPCKMKVALGFIQSDFGHTTLPIRKVSLFFYETVNLSLQIATPKLTY